MSSATALPPISLPRIPTPPPSAPLPPFSHTWHPRLIPLSTLHPVRALRPYIFECTLATARVIAKIAPTDGHLGALAHEAAVYQAIEAVRPPRPLCPPAGRDAARADATLGLAAAIAPHFLGHVVDERGRAVGFVLERVEGRHARAGDEMACVSALARLHLLGVAHGDVQRDNFIVRPDGGAVVLDFEYSRPGAAAGELQREMAEVAGCLARRPRRRS